MDGKSSVKMKKLIINFSFLVVLLGHQAGHYCYSEVSTDNAILSASDSISNAPDKEEGKSSGEVSITARLGSESLRESLQNAGRVEDFYKPGYHPPAALPQPLDDIRIILSNPRFEKVYLELSALPSEQACDELNRSFSYHLDYLRSFIAEYKGTEVSAEKLNQLNRISSQEGADPPLIGEIHALRMIALLGGILESEGMKPSLESAFAHPAAGFELNLTEYHPGLQHMLTSMPVFPEKFQFQVWWLLEKEKNGGFETKRLPISPTKARRPESDIPINSTVLRQLGKPLELEFLDIPYDAEL